MVFNIAFKVFLGQHFQENFNGKKLGRNQSKQKMNSDLTLMLEDK